MKSSHHFRSNVSSISADKAIQALDQGALLLASSSQLASEWKSRFALASGDNVVSTPAVENWQQWLAGLGREYEKIPAPFNSIQEQQLWEQVITTDLNNANSAYGLARHAAKAYRSIREYRIDPQELIGSGEEAEALYRWIDAMQKLLKEQGRILIADVPELLLPEIGSLAGVEHILIDGFDQFTPLQLALMQELEGQGLWLEMIAMASDLTTPTLMACPDVKSECCFAVSRIKKYLEGNPDARIGIVTVGQMHANFGRMLDEALLTPDESDLQAVAMMGAPLVRQPLIRQLLCVLALAGSQGARHTAMASLFFSPGIRGHAEEYHERAMLDAKLREDNCYYLRLSVLRTMAEARGMTQLALVVSSLGTWDTSGRTAGEWVGAVHGLLQTVGFLQPDVGVRSNGEIRALNSFRECLASLVAVDAVRGRMAWGEFLALISSVCNELRFSLPIAYPGVSVLPIEQVAGLRFDVVFAIGCDNEALPLSARPIPLLPFALQHRYGLFGTTASLAFNASDFLWQQLKQSAPVVHASYARQRDERELDPSPLLAGIEASILTSAMSVPATIQTESWDDAPMVPFKAGEEVRGGSAIIKNQSACPFRAFATHRLGLVSLGETEPGIQPTEKGDLIHSALQFIWERVHSKSELLELDEAAQEKLVDSAVDHAWQEARVTVDEATQAFERRRMVALLLAWFDEERKRPAFSVEACERGYALNLPERGDIRIPIRLKIDRIDSDVEGHKILIDYKTGGKQNINQWIGERPAEPQLPLYAVAEELGAVDAVCFAQIRSGDGDSRGFKGLSGEPTGIKGISVYKGKDEAAGDWLTLLALWRERIDALAKEFVMGRNEVAPRDARACAYCGLEAACRIDEIGINRDENDEVES